MGRQRYSDLAGFWDWLTNVRHMTDRSAASYCSGVRSTLKNVPFITSETLAAHFMSVSDSTRYTKRAQWRAFVEFAGDRGIEVALPAQTAIRSKRVYEVPDEVLDAVWAILKDSSLNRNDLVNLCWGDVREVGQDVTYHVAIPNEAHTFAPVLKIHMNKIREWAAPDGEHPADPILPIMPRSGQAIPYNVLKRLLATRKRSLSW